jgi:hypothetical protein
VLGQCSLALKSISSSPPFFRRVNPRLNLLTDHPEDENDA